MTPCFSMLKYLLYQARRGTRDLKKVVFIWTARDIATLKSIELDLNPEDCSNKELDSNSVAHYELYLTKKSNVSDLLPIFHYLFIYLFIHLSIDLFCF